jgi:L-threonate 2-dehydrogenase
VNTAQVEAVLFDGGAAAALAANGTVIVSATCPPGAMADIASRIEALGLRCVDAPVSGGVGGATAGSLTIMVGASTPVFAAARPVLDVLGSKVVHVGERPGQGAVVKTINQLLCGVHIAVAAEALALAAKIGVDQAIILDVVGGSAASSWMLRDRGPRMLEADPAVASAVDIFVKDLGIVMEAGRDSKAALPLAALAHQMFLAASGQGRGKADDSQVIRAYAALNGM